MKTVTELNILNEVKEVVASTLRIPYEQLDVHAELESLGMDSIIAMELMANISKKINVSVTPAQFIEVNTINELAAIIEKSVHVETESKEPLSDSLPQLDEKTAPVSIHNIGQESSQSRISRNNKISFQKVLDRIHQNYSIDLSYHQTFKTINEIVDVLISEHLNELLLHYNLSDESFDKVPELENVNPSTKKNITNLHRVDEIAIVGISCNFPDASDANKFWNNLIAQKNSIREIPKNRWDWEDYYADSAISNKTNSKWGALIDDIDCFDAHFFNIQQDEAVFMDPQERLLIQEVYKAFQDGGIDPVKLKKTKTGVFMSYEYSEYEHYLRDNIERIPAGFNTPVFSSSSPTYYLANRLSFLFDFYGPSESVNVNCAGSAVAINRAYYSLLNQESDVAVIGGVSLNLFADDYISLSKYGMLSPNGTCAVFDEDANGFTRGEGVAAVILKRLTDAERDNNKIYGIIKSSHQNNRGNARFLSEIKIESITNVLNDCYKTASIEPESMYYIEVDGYATKWGDSFEFEGIKNAFVNSKSKEKYCALGSLKGNIGNLESVNGLASFIKMALSLYYKKFPATISKKKTSSFIDIENPSHPLYIADTTIEFEKIRRGQNPVRAGINSFADSGVNVHIVLEEYLAEQSPIIDTSSSQVFILSAKDSDGLDKYVQDYIRFISESKEDSSFCDMIYTLQTGREMFAERLAIIASSYAELLRKLSLFKQSSSEKSFNSEKEEIFCGNIFETKDNLLANLITKDMTNQYLENQQWKQISQLWVNGVEIPWNRIWEKKTAHIVTLPSYPFAKERIWIDLFDKNKKEPSAKQDGTNYKQAPENETTQIGSLITPEWFFYISNDKKDVDEFQPGEKIKLFLQQEVAVIQQTPLKDIDVNSNYLELGLNSLNLLTVISKVNSLLQVNISPGLLYTYSDIEKLAEYVAVTFPEKVQRLSVTKDQESVPNSGSEDIAIDKDNISLQPSQIVLPMQMKGKHFPIFIIPGADGSVIALQHLIQALGNGQPVYGLESVGLDGRVSPLKSIQEIAKFNITAMQTVQATGPYQLLGYSSGGIVVFEMARILLERGEKIETLFILDTLCPTLAANDIIEDIVEVFKSLFITASGNKLDLDAQRLKQLPENEIPIFLNSVIKQNGFDWPQEQFSAAFNVIMSNEKNCRAYQPSKLPGEIDTILFKAIDGHIKGYENLPEDYGWNQVLTSPVQIHHIHGDHFSMINKEHSPEIAKVIKSQVKNNTGKQK